MTASMKRALLGPFEVEAQIGHGGMGEVWRAIHSDQGTPVALKVISAAVNHPEQRAHFSQEARAIAGMSHPNIIQVFDQGIVDPQAAYDSRGELPQGAPWLAMELVNGGTLKDLLPSLSWPTTRHVLFSTLSAMAHAHSRNVIHRDIKPSNLLICDQGDHTDFKLADFGLAARPDRDIKLAESKGMSPGTPQYMAPEQFEGKWRDYGPWTDLYALGCMAFEMVCGALPFQGAQIFQLAYAHIMVPVPALTPRFPVPRGLEAWIASLLHKATRDRPQSAAHAARALMSLDPASSPHPYESALLNDAPLTPSSRRKGDRHATIATPGGSPDLRAQLQLMGVGLGLYGQRTPPLVGRRREQTLLRDALDTVQSTQNAQWVHLGGAPGQGKSRLAQWICQHAQTLGLATPLTTYHSREGSLGDGLQGTLTRHLRCQGLNRQETLQRTRALLQADGVEDPLEWRGLTEWMKPAQEGQQPFARFGTLKERFPLAWNLLRRLSERTHNPVILWVDDIQWGPRALAWCQFVMTRAARDPIPLLIVSTGRSGPLDETMDGVAQAGLVHRVNIGPLDPESHKALVEALLGLNEALTRQVTARSDGNPLFAVQLIGDWVQRGVLRPGAAGFELAPGEQAHLPDDIHGVWVAHMERLMNTLDLPSEHPLELAAVLGQRVSDAEWARACALDPDTDLAAVKRALLRARLALPQDGGWRFAHGMLRETLLRLARESGRLQDHHKVCAQTLEDLYGPHVQDRRVGQHRAMAGQHTLALAPLLRAAQHSVTAGDYTQGQSLLTQLNQVLTDAGIDDDDPQRVTPLVLTSHILRQLGQLDESSATCAQAVAIAWQHGDLKALTEAELESARISVARGHMAQAAESYELALRHAHQADDDLLQGQAARGLGQVRFFQGRHQESLALYDESLVHLSEHAPEAERMQTLVNIADSHDALMDWPRSIPVYLQALDFYRRTGNRYRIAYVLNSLGNAHRRSGDLHSALDNYEQALEVSVAIGSTAQITVVLNQAMVLMARSQWGEARRRLEDLRRSLEATGQNNLLQGVYAELLPCLAHEGAWPLYDQLFERVSAMITQSGAAYEDDAWSLHAAADAALNAGHSARAASAHELAAHLWRQLGRDDKLALITP